MSEKWPQLILATEPRDANSSVQASLDWWQKTFADRLAAGDKVIWVQSRLHEADTPGWISP